MEYTSWRRFLAWFGFVSIFAWVALLITITVYANAFINAAI